MDKEKICKKKRFQTKIKEKIAQKSNRPQLISEGNNNSKKAQIMACEFY